MWLNNSTSCQNASISVNMAAIEKKHKNITVYVKKVNDPPICYRQGKLKMEWNCLQQYSSSKCTDQELQSQWVLVLDSTAETSSVLMQMDILAVQIISCSVA